jgi:hypothetical protein
MPRSKDRLRVGVVGRIVLSAQRGRMHGHGSCDGNRRRRHDGECAPPRYHLREGLEGRQDGEASTAWLMYISWLPPPTTRLSSPPPPLLLELASSFHLRLALPSFAFSPSIWYRPSYPPFKLRQLFGVSPDNPSFNNAPRVIMFSQLVVLACLAASVVATTPMQVRQSPRSRLTGSFRSLTRCT